MRGAALSDSLAIIPQRRVPSSHTGPCWVTQLPYGAALPAVLPAELLLPWEKKRLGAKRGFKPLYEGIKGLCPGFRSCFLFLFLLLSIFVFLLFFFSFPVCSLFPLKHTRPQASPAADGPGAQPWPICAPSTCQDPFAFASSQLSDRHFLPSKRAWLLLFFTVFLAP